MEPSELKYGVEYRIKDSVKVKAASGPMIYAGKTVYRDKIYHEFWEPSWALKHWINPEDVEPV